jgi:hypothetical protein
VGPFQFKTSAISPQSDRGIPHPRSSIDLGPALHKKLLHHQVRSGLLKIAQRFIAGWGGGTNRPTESVSGRLTKSVASFVQPSAARTALSLGSLFPAVKLLGYFQLSAARTGRNSFCAKPWGPGIPKWVSLISLPCLWALMARHHLAELRPPDSFLLLESQPRCGRLCERMTQSVDWPKLLRDSLAYRDTLPSSRMTPPH